jgi:hypothetical protein
MIPQLSTPFDVLPPTPIFKPHARPPRRNVQRSVLYAPIAVRFIRVGRTHVVQRTRKPQGQALLSRRRNPVCDAPICTRTLSCTAKAQHRPRDALSNCHVRALLEQLDNALIHDSPLRSRPSRQSALDNLSTFRFAAARELRTLRFTSANIPTQTAFCNGLQ